jgi:probable O-glycosylation ligase (exosortase A-associated)
MPVRDIALVIVVVSLLPVCFLRTWVGVLVWCWLAFMNPHRLVWDFAYYLPFSQWVAIATLAGLVFARDRQPMVWTRETVLLLVLWGWFCLTTMGALYPEDARGQLERVSKILLMTFLVIPFFQDRGRLRILLLVVAGSIGFYGLKGGIWVLLTGGQYHVLGPPEDTFISTNNALALVLNMILPVLFYLAKEETRRWRRHLLYATFYASIISVLFTYSRGGLVGLLVVLGVLFLNRQNLPYVAAAALLLCVLAFGFAPDKWLGRMETIANYQEDGSANARFTSWYVAFRLANDSPVTGGGFWGVANQQTYQRYLPGAPYGDLPQHDAHSIYFGLLGEHGYPGLALFAMLIGSTLLSLSLVRKRALQREDLRWAANYASMLRASILGYLVCGTFLSVAYFDLAYLLLAVAVLVKALVHRELAKDAPMATAQRVGLNPQTHERRMTARLRRSAPFGPPQ